MSCENVKIKDYRITKLNMDFGSLSQGEHKLSLTISLNIMTPKDAQDKECIVVIEINFYSEDKTSILSAEIRGYTDVDASLSEEEKNSQIKANAVPVFYDILRNFISETTKKANVEFPNIPFVEEIDF